MATKIRKNHNPQESCKLWLRFYVMLEGYSCSIMALTSLAFTV